jgi:hypothetical protein
MSTSTCWTFDAGCSLVSPATRRTSSSRSGLPMERGSRSRRFTRARLSSACGRLPAEKRNRSESRDSRSTGPRTGSFCCTAERTQSTGLVPLMDAQVGCGRCLWMNALQSQSLTEAAAASSLQRGAGWRSSPRSQVRWKYMFKRFQSPTARSESRAMAGLNRVER